MVEGQISFTWRMKRLEGKSDFVFVFFPHPPLCTYPSPYLMIQPTFPPLTTADHLSAAPIKLNDYAIKPNEYTQLTNE